MSEEGLPDINTINFLRRRFTQRAQDEEENGNSKKSNNLYGIAAGAGTILALYATYLRISAIGE